ncbi:MULTISPECIES: hypothetical protein [Anaeromyxobacter]|uniref:hypothetical protein n=1 Tax=Anaeromyxobacter TaxID=161492 RepID=UPI001F59E093|nr:MULTISPECIES: hypothetical protein [unclassified Anaeromyxobacter]
MLQVSDLRASARTPPRGVRDDLGASRANPRQRPAARTRPGGRAGAAACAAAALVASSGCAAHLPRADERVPFLERSYVSLTTDRRQAFEADPALHLVLWNGLEDPGLQESGGVTTSLSMSFLGMFRLLREDSTPVRTPTYEPRAKLQIFAAARPEDAGAAPRGPRTLAALELSVGHRSNGQQGCALTDHLRTGKGDFDCVPLTDPPSERLDLSAGSFTTNYLGAAVGGLRQLGAGRGRAILSARSSAEWNVPCGLGACMPAQMRRRYGAVVGRASAELELPALWHLTRALPLVAAHSELGLRLGLAGSRHLGTVARPAFGDLAAEVTLLARAPRSLGLGLFLRRQQGRDPLNIRFEERLDAWMVGFVAEPGAP